MEKSKPNIQFCLDFDKKPQDKKVSFPIKREPKVIKFYPHSYYPEKVKEYFTSLSAHVLNDF